MRTRSPDEPDRKFVQSNLGEIKVMTKVSRFLNDESGATAIEYGLIAALIGVGIIGGAQVLRTQLDTTFRSIATSLSTALSFN